VVWDNAEEIAIPATDLEKTPRAGSRFADLPSSASQSRNYTTWSRDFSNWLYGTQKVDLFVSPSTKEVSMPGESEQEFRVRIQQSSHEQRDNLVEQLRNKYAARIAALQERLRRAQQMKQEQADQARQAGLQTAVAIGSTLLGAFTSRRLSSTTISRASSTLRGVGRAFDESKDVARAGDTVEAIQKQLEDLQAEFNAEAAELQARIDPSTEVFQSVSVKPNKTDILVQLVALVWVPHWQDAAGSTTPAW
jgi:hypothetical protein